MTKNGGHLKGKYNVSELHGAPHHNMAGEGVLCNSEMLHLLLM